MSKNESLPPGLLTYKVSTDPDPLYINDPDSKLLITVEKNADVYLDVVFIEVPADSGSSADALFFTDPALTYHMTPDTEWQIQEEGNNKSGSVPVTQFSVKPKGSANQITEDLHVTITGTSNADKGTVQVVIGEHSGKSPGQYEYHETKFPVTKSAAMPFYLNNLVSFDPNDPDTPKLSFKISDEIYLSWDSNGASYELFPKDLVTTGNPTADTHITIPAGAITKDQTIVIKATDGDKTLYQSLNICIENPHLTPSSSIISGTSEENSLQLSLGNAIIDGNALFVTSPSVFDTNRFAVIAMNGNNTAKLEVTDRTTIVGDLMVNADEAGKSSTILNRLSVHNESRLADSEINGSLTIRGPITIDTKYTKEDKIEANVDADFNKKVTVADELTTNSGIQANGGIYTTKLEGWQGYVRLMTDPELIFHGTGTVSGFFNATTDGYLIFPNTYSSTYLFLLAVTVEVIYPYTNRKIKYERAFFQKDQLPNEHASMIIPISNNAEVLLSFSVNYLPMPGTGNINYDVWWKGLGQGDPKFYWNPNPTEGPLPEAFELVRQEHAAMAEQVRQKPEKARSFIQNLEKATGQSFDTETLAELTKDLESLL